MSTTTNDDKLQASIWTACLLFIVIGMAMDCTKDNKLEELLEQIQEDLKKGMLN